MNTKSIGFTLVELLIVIVIVGALASVLIPLLLGSRSRALDTSAANCAKLVAASQEVLFIDTHSYAESLATLNTATDNMANTCESDWVDDSASFLVGWVVSHPDGSGQVYDVGPGGITPPP